MKDRGFILVNVLLLVAALSFVALEMLRQRSANVVRLGVAQEAGQIALIADAGVMLAAGLLTRDLEAGEVDHAGEAWALDRFRAEAGGGEVIVTVRDIEARLNLNLLALPQVEASEVLGALVRATGRKPDAAAAIVTYYAQVREREPDVPDPEAGKHFQTGDLTMPAQLRQFGLIVETDEPGLVAQLSTLPRARGINVNTTSREVLAALPGLRSSDVSGLVSLREQRPFEAVPLFLEAVAALAGPAVAEALPTDVLGVSSNWFEVETEARLGDLVRRSRTILWRDPESGEVSPFAQSFGVTG